MQQYDLSIRDVAPAPHATRLTGVRADGLPDGEHTGGAWLLDGEVWKPLDGRPFANATRHVQTSEDTALDALSHIPICPRNWRVEDRSGRRFLVRKVATMIHPATLSECDISTVVSSIRQINLAGWEVGDEITLGRDENGILFIVDLSAARWFNGIGCWKADDSARVIRMLKLWCENRKKTRNAIASAREGD